MDDLRDDAMMDALANIEAYGDIAPDDNSPAASVMRQRVDILRLVILDQTEGTWTLTAYGQERLARYKRRISGQRCVVLQFPRRAVARSEAVASHRVNRDRPAPRAPAKKSDDNEQDFRR